MPPVLYIIIVTTNCNRSRRYWGGKLEAMPKTIQYQISELQNFIIQDQNHSIAFYSGEPLLDVRTIQKILDTIPTIYYIINTNGYNIEALSDDIHQFDTILLSIDGRPPTTDYYRGKGCTDQVLSAVHHLKNHHYTGELIARMTVSH
ncbi:MAG: hypothetical protein KKC68_05870 [Candidatus Thermoplasmatota archaeon]|nr:hypothetical protein [Candidatus Thermoplasmatota archaeon]MBU1941284.1 hypothetical protein [Candidatus Thermoplasmatota archaeon]